jgi:hypothetical protein
MATNAAQLPLEFDAKSRIGHISKIGDAVQRKLVDSPSNEPTLGGDELE